MTKSDIPGCELPAAVRRRARRVRISAGVVLLAGLAGAGAVYWLGSRPPDYSADPSMVGFRRSEERQMGMLYGKQGQLIEDFNESLKQPGTQALLILGAAVVVAAGCFHFARVVEAEALENADASNLPAGRGSD
jgi:hypothetical protein